ncbi:hypothetical protein [Rhizobium phaseoli]|uniref:hypothetical protein n=1 Tax=Rhizobium phaseoli TaxID=396 RepID=UPI0002FABB14|nr:hypothetical protein [Rhizobium phaseoli]KKZ89081.1 hypothetical protein RPHASCH2410_CH00360 [Rhizobium phaseoli Ch24-10]
MSRPKEAKRSGEPGWSWRRAVIFPLIVFACWRLMVMENAPDTVVNQTIAWGWIILIISLVFFYTGFATAQDIAAILATRTGLPYASPPVAVDGEPLVEPYEPPTRPFNPNDTGGR